MDAFPHHYRVTVSGQPDTQLSCRADQLPELQVAPPTQFGGPGDQWSPEDLLMASIANCLALSFKAIATASRLEWIDFHCEAEGTLDKVERKLMFTSVNQRVKLVVPASVTEEKAIKLLEKAEANCLISNSLACESHLQCEIVIQS